MQCDVIIPTYQARDVLPQSLRALVEQTLPPDWQMHVVVSDDGSTDETVGVAEEFFTHHQLPHTVIAGPHTGVSGARNRALTLVNGDVVLLLGADILLRPNAVAAHLTYHQQHPAENMGALGFVTWDPRLRPTPLMEWLVHGGPQNDFDALLGQVAADPEAFLYGSHLSLKRSLVQRARFSTDFTFYGWEDLELGIRLAQAGLHLAVLSQARGLHHHFYTSDHILSRQYLAGAGVRTLQRLHPKLVLAPRLTWQRRLRHYFIVYSGVALVVAWWLRFGATRFSQPSLFAKILAHQFLWGYIRGLPVSKAEAPSS